MSVTETIDTQIKRRISQLDFADSGQIVSVDPTTYSVDVAIHGASTLILTKVPVLSQASRAASGIIMLPDVGDTVVVLYLEPNKAGPVVIGSYYSNTENNDENYAVFHTTADDWLLQHKSGAYIKINALGDIILNCATGREIQMTKSP